MALTGSGQLKFSEMRDEFGGSGQVKFSDLYRGGSLVRANAANNSTTNLAAGVPTSGEIQVADFYSQAKGFRKTYSSGATNQDASAVFGDDYGVDYPKEIVINSGVELGATSTSQEALQIDSGLSGTMTITNNGTLSGAGGAANGGAGGDAFQADVACTLINNGTIRAGGGGGGKGGNGGTGGTGGQGSTSTTSLGSRTSQIICGGCPPVGQYGCNSGDTCAMYCGYCCGGDGNHRYACYQTITNYTYYNGGSGGSGGSGGNGGVGAGYNQSSGSGASGSGGSGGSSGGTNAGSGGTGGTGGSGGAGGGFGSSGSSGNTGSTGSTGNNGNHTNGSGGSSGSSGSGGGAAGKYIRGISNVTLTQNGTVQGGTA